MDSLLVLLNRHFTPRVWEATGVDANGKQLFSSRTVTPEDRKRRIAYLRRYYNV